MKNIFLLYAQLILFWNLSAQDIIILRNGDEIKSIIMEVNINDIKYKKYENPEGPSYTVNKSELIKIKFENGTQEVFNQTSNNKKNLETENSTYDVYRKKEKPVYNYKISGFINISEIDLIKSFANLIPDIATINGYQINEYFSTGIGIAYSNWYYDLEFSNTSTRNALQIHSLLFFLDARVHLMKRKTTPFLFIDFGRSIILNSNQTGVYYDYQNDTSITVNLKYKGGNYSNFGIGIKTFINNKIGFLADLSFGRMFYNIVYPPDCNCSPTYRNRDFKAVISLKTGITF